MKSWHQNWTNSSAVVLKVESDLYQEGLISFASSSHSLTYSTNCKIHIFAHEFSRFRKSNYDRCICLFFLFFLPTKND